MRSLVSLGPPLQHLNGVSGTKKRLLAVAAAQEVAACDFNRSVPFFLRIRRVNAALCLNLAYLVERSTYALLPRRWQPGRVVDGVFID